MLTLLSLQKRTNLLFLKLEKKSKKKRISFYIFKFLKQYENKRLFIIFTLVKLYSNLYCLYCMVILMYIYDL